MDEIELEDLSHRLPSSIALGKSTENLLSTEQEQEPTGTIVIAQQQEAERLDLSRLLPSSILPSKEYVENWLDTEVVNKRDSLSKYTNGGLLIFGSLSSTARGSVYFILGYKLSEDFLVTSVSSPGNHVLSVLYATASSVPMTLLGVASSQKFLKYLITSTPQNFINIKKEESRLEKSLRISKNTFLIGASACSASILTYIAYDNYNPLIGWFWLGPGLPTFYVRTLIDFYAMTALGGAAYDKFISDPKNKRLYETRPESREANIHEIKKLLHKSKNFVSSLNYKQAKILEDIVNNSGEELSQKIKAFANPEFFVRDDVTIIKSSYGREVVGYLGGAVAVCGMYLYYEGTKAAFGFTQPLFKLNSEETNYTEASLSIFSLATASSLSAIAAHSSAQKFYDLASTVLTGSYKKISSFFKRRENESSPISPSPRSREDKVLMVKRAGVASLAFLLASCDAGTLYELAAQQHLSMHDFGNVLALVSSSVSLFSMSFWAVDEALMYYVRGSDPKTSVLSLIDQIDRTLSSMSDSALEALKDILRTSHGFIEEEIEVEA